MKVNLKHLYEGFEELQATVNTDNSLRKNNICLRGIKEGRSDQFEKVSRRPFLLALWVLFASFKPS